MAGVFTGAGGGSGAAARGLPTVFFGAFRAAANGRDFRERAARLRREGGEPDLAALRGTTRLVRFRTTAKDLARARPSRASPSLPLARLASFLARFAMSLASFRRRFARRAFSLASA